MNLVKNLLENCSIVLEDTSLTIFVTMYTITYLGHIKFHPSLCHRCTAMMIHCSNHVYTLDTVHTGHRNRLSNQADICKIKQSMNTLKSIVSQINYIKRFFQKRGIFIKVYQWRIENIRSSTKQTDKNFNKLKKPFSLSPISLETLYKFTIGTNNERRRYDAYLITRKGRRDDSCWLCSRLGCRGSPPDKRIPEGSVVDPEIGQ